MDMQHEEMADEIRDLRAKVSALEQRIVDIEAAPEQLLAALSEAFAASPLAGTPCKRN